MLSKEQVKEILEHLEKAQNPIFYYDNDTDGLCSFLLFRRFIGRGKGVAIRSYPDLNKEYVRKVRELNADYVFVLDKPLISKEFVEEIEKMNIPIVWIDHHDMENEIEDKKVFVYNTAKGKDKSFEPISYWAYKITNRKEDIWISILGCIADHYLPDYSKEFKKEYPDFWGNNIKEPFDVYFNTEIGKIALALNFGLKDSTTHIVQLQSYLINCKNPGEVLMESRENKNFINRYNELKKKYDDLVNKALESKDVKLIFFEYGGDMSISSEIANAIYYKNQGKYILVAFKKQGVSNLSLRGKNVRDILAKVLKKISGTGGGHEDAVGARINSSDLQNFKEEFEKEINNKRE